MEPKGAQAWACTRAAGFSLLRTVSSYGDSRLVAAPTNRRAYGVPPGGPFDRLSAALANALVGADGPVLEIALGPVVFEALEGVTLAVVGGPDGAFDLQKGDRLEIRPQNARAYVAVGKGPTRRLADPPRVGGPLRVLPGPHAPLLDLNRRYTVALASNRVGVRLEGPLSPHSLSLPSEPAVPGVVQLPPSGHPIVFGPDGPTIGGYPKVAVVIGADLDRLGRLRPGDEVRFEAVGMEEAREAAREARVERERRVAEIQISNPLRPL